MSETLLPALREWCISVVCGKDAVPRMTTNTLARLMDEMVTALARARCRLFLSLIPQHYLSMTTNTLALSPLSMMIPQHDVAALVSLLLAWTSSSR